MSFILPFNCGVNIVIGLLFRGQWSAQAMGYSFTNEPVRYKGMIGSNEKKSFLVLSDVVAGFAEKIPGSTLKYIMPTKR